MFNQNTKHEAKKSICRIFIALDIIDIGYHLPLQHNELFHLPHMEVAEISLGISRRVRPEEPFLLLKYSTNPKFLLLTVSLL